MDNSIFEPARKTDIVGQYDVFVAGGGIAAAICQDITKLSVADLQKQLSSAGVKLHESELA